jgi:hypothetical protein
MLKNYLVALLFILAPAILAILGLYWFMDWGLHGNRYFGVMMLGAVIGYAILRYGCDDRLQ